jgi:hypothetical protein
MRLRKAELLIKPIVKVTQGSSAFLLREKGGVIPCLSVWDSFESGR